MKSEARNSNRRRGSQPARPAPGALPPGPQGPGGEPVQASQDLIERMLRLIGAAAGECEKIQAEFGKNPPPDLETLIKLHRVIVLNLCNTNQRDEKTLEMITRLMRPVMDYARLQELRRHQALAEQKYQDEQAAAQVDRARQQRSSQGADLLQPETIEKIEHELKLF